jgi:hypothetical protein
MSKSKSVMLLGAVCLQILIASCGSQPGTNAQPSEGTKVAGVPTVGTVQLIHIKGNDTVNDPNPSPSGNTELSQGHDDRLTWINDTNSDYYVCFDPSVLAKQPFHAIVFFVPAGKQRDSGKIRDDASTGEVFYHVYQGPKMCAAPDYGVHGQPKIVIKP